MQIISSYEIKLMHAKLPIPTLKIELIADRLSSLNPGKIDDMLKICPKFSKVPFAHNLPIY
jgi:hypothetical protein